MLLVTSAQGIMLVHLSTPRIGSTPDEPAADPVVGTQPGAVLVCLIRT